MKLDRYDSVMFATVLRCHSVIQIERVHSCAAWQLEWVVVTGWWLHVVRTLNNSGSRTTRSSTL